MIEAAAAGGCRRLEELIDDGRGQRLEVNAYGGEITVSAWNRNAVRVEANTSR